MKICGATGCNNPVFSNNFCLQHQYLRKDDKYKKQIQAHRDTFYNKKGSTLGKRKKPSKTIKNTFKMKWGYNSQIEMFKDIWKTREHRSFISDRSLDVYDIRLWINLFAHVLSKGKYPVYKLNPENVVLLTPYEHILFDQGTERERLNYHHHIPECNWERLYDFQDMLKEEYKEILKQL